jgi:hypothetical protein
VYDVSIDIDGHQVGVAARYNADATATNFDTVEDVHGTGPAGERYRETVTVLGEPPDPADIRDDLTAYLAHIEQVDWRDM